MAVPAIPDPRAYGFASPNSGAEAVYERSAATKLAANKPANRAHLSFVNASAEAALATLDRVASIAAYAGTP